MRTDGLGLAWSGDTTGRRTFLGRPWTALTGRTVTSLKGIGWQKSVADDDRRRYLRQLRGAAAARGPIRTSYRVKGADGQWHLLIEEAVPQFDRRDRLTGFVGICVEANPVDTREPSDATSQTETDALRSLSNRLEAAREEERSRLARELHDELGQVLTSTKLDLMWLCDRMRQPEARPSVSVVNKLQSLAGLVELAIVSVQRITMDLKPPLLDHLGLKAALEWEATKFHARTGIRCHTKATLRDSDLDAPRATAVFRIAQEALTNVARHARAGAVRLSLRRAKGRIVLEVQDNGRGITERESRDPRSVGLLGMRERAHQFDGELQISGAPGRGTKLLVSIPSQNADA